MRHCQPPEAKACLAPGTQADGMEYLLQDLGIEKESRAEIEPISFTFDRRGPSSDLGLLFDDGDFYTGFGQQHG